MKLYNFNQNNSGGSFTIDENVTYDVLIEANSLKGANKRADRVGIYFDGCSEGYDCSCCGDRWNKAYNDEVNEYSVFEFPDKESAITYFSNEQRGMFRTEKIIHWKDGSKIRIQLKD